MRRVRRVAGKFSCRISGGGEGGKNSEILKTCESALPRKGKILNSCIPVFLKSDTTHAKLITNFFPQA